MNTMDIDLGLGSSTDTKESQVQRAVGAPTRDLEKLVMMLAKLTLSNTLQIRIIKAIVIEGFRFPADHSIIQAALKETKESQPVQE